MRKGHELLIEGLGKGYVGETEFGEIRLAGVPFSTSDCTPDQGEGHYHDQWIKGINGGGQEVANTGLDGATRLYAGGLVDAEVLERLGVTGPEVIKYLVTTVGRLKGATRLTQVCEPPPDGPWQYIYRVINEVPEIQLTIGLETIQFDDTLVFAHGFLNSPIKS